MTTILPWSRQSMPVGRDRCRSNECTLLQRPARTRIRNVPRAHCGKGGSHVQAIADKAPLSEASVQRMFSRQDFTLQRMEGICNIAGLELADLAWRGN